MYLLSVYFDEKTQEKLQSMTEKIAVKNQSSYVLEHRILPHMTVAMLHTDDIEALKRKVEALVAGLTAGELHFVSVSSFKTSALYVLPVMNQYLYDLAERIAGVLKQEQVPSSRYVLYQWVPHVTLEKHMSEQEQLAGFAVLQKQFAPFTGRVISVGLAQVNPYQDIWREALS